MRDLIEGALIGFPGGILFAHRLRWPPPTTLEGWRRRIERRHERAGTECRWFWGSHGCYRRKGHKGDCRCTCGQKRPAQIGWFL